MKSRLRAAVIVVVLLVAGFFAWRSWSPRPGDSLVLSGYVEGDDLFLSAPAAGPVGAVYVVKGQRVAAGAPLFAMDQGTLSAQHDQAASRLDQARAQIGAAEAQARQAEASVAAAQSLEANAKRDMDRLVGLQRSNPQAVAGQQVDQARSAAANATAQRVAAQQAATAASVQASAARSAAGQAEGGVREAGVRLGQLAQTAPAGGRIEDVFYQRGEWAGPNQPVVALLPDDRIKLRFYVPEGDVQLYQPGRKVSFGCDSCRKDLSAVISYVTPRAEFPPPVIYSRGSRDKLVFLVEAVPAAGVILAPGLPVDVTPLAGSGLSRP